MPQSRQYRNSPDAFIALRLSRCPLLHQDQVTILQLGPLRSGHRQTSLALGLTIPARVALCILTPRCRESEGFRIQHLVHLHNCP